MAEQSRAILEQQVRQELAVQYADDILQNLGQYGFLDEIKKLWLDIVGATLDVDNTLSQEEREQELSGIATECTLSPAQFREMAYQKAKQIYASKEEILAEQQKFYDSLKEDFGEEALAELKKADANLPASLDLIQRYVSALVDVAEKEGVEAAVSKERRYEAIRQVWPTAEEYIASYSGSAESVKQQMQQIEKAGQMDGEVGAVMAIVARKNLEFIARMQEKFGELLREYVQKQVREIYS